MKISTKYLDSFLNKTTMYKLVLFCLANLLVIALVLSIFDLLSVSPLGIILSTTVLVTVCWAANKLLSRLFSVAMNTESAIITALILASILPPSTSVERLSYIAVGGFAAVASKFIITYKGSHIFNPAVAGALVLSLTGLMSVTWWMGNPTMFPFVVISGLLIIRKVRHFSMAITFVVTAVAMLLFVGVMDRGDPMVLLQNAVLSGPLIFFAAIMLTEPATMPSTFRNQILFAALVGALYSSQLKVGIFSTTPHLVLALGNIFALAVSPHYTVKLKLKQASKISGQVYHYIFTPSRKMSFTPGQYMEWTLPHKNTDIRGNRRSFTIASSPTENEVQLGIKFYEPSSSFKNALKNMKVGGSMFAGQVKGSFTMPDNKKIPLVFVAGGIGVTPFRSMIKYLVDTDEKRLVKLIYSVGKKEELAYTELFESASGVGVTYIPVVSEPGKSSLTQKILKTSTPALYYLSGPEPFIRSTKSILLDMKVPKSRIRTDYFSGY